MKRNMIKYVQIFTDLAVRMGKNMEYYLGLAVATLVMIVIIIAAVSNRNKNIVIENSERLKKLDELNAKTKFKELESQYSNEHQCVSRAEFNRLTEAPITVGEAPNSIRNATTLDTFLFILIDENADYYDKLIQAAEKNKEGYQRYLRRAKRIVSTVDETVCKKFKISTEKFKKIEEKLFEKKILPEPICEISLKCCVYYITPKRRDEISSTEIFSHKQVKQMHEKVIKSREEREVYSIQKEVERAKMTASLRYDIFRRDGFRCQICGATAKDGAKLHVDHILPVSKGGLTVPNILRTLCDRCNLGKRDKIENV